ncbi:MAG: glycine--tRNA ligase subunit alpha [Pseudomonadota bacterium]
MTSRPTCLQDIITRLNSFWGAQGCALITPYDMEVGAGTFHPATTLRALGPDDHWACAYLQPSRRPADGRYGDNPNRLYQHLQYQVFIRPSPEDIQDTYLASLARLGIDQQANDVRFVEDDWESPTLGAAGLGWEVWCQGMEITQFTYFQQMGGFDCKRIPVELTYGLERLALHIFGLDNVFDIPYNPPGAPNSKTYRDIFWRAEKEQSTYSFEHSDLALLRRHFDDAENQAQICLDKDLAIPAYEQCLKASHLFNLIDARTSLASGVRTNYIARVRAMAKRCCQIWLESG